MTINRSITTNHWNTTFYKNNRRTLESADQLLQTLTAESADATIQVLLTHYTTDYNAYKASYLNWLSAVSIYRGSGAILKTYFTDLSGDKINRVDTFLKNCYLDEKESYITLMSQGREPFQKGSYTNRVLFTENLATAMLLRTELVTIAQDFKDFSLALATARQTQRTNAQRVKNASAVLENKRELIAASFYWVYGGLIQKNSQIPKNIERYYEINKMYAKASVTAAVNPNLVVVELNPLEKKEAGINFMPTDQISITNVGNAEAEVYITDGGTSILNPVKRTIAAGEELLLNPGDFATTNCRYMYLHNLDNEFKSTLHLIKIVNKVV